MSDKIRKNIRDSWLKRFSSPEKQEVSSERPASIASSALEDQRPHKKQKLNRSSERSPPDQERQKIIISLLDLDEEVDHASEVEEIKYNDSVVEEINDDMSEVEEIKRNTFEVEEIKLKDSYIERVCATKFVSKASKSKEFKDLSRIRLSPIQVVHSPVLPQKDTIKLSSLFTDEVVESYQFSMQVDVDFLVDIIMKNCRHPKKIHIIANDVINYEEYIQNARYSDVLNSWTHKGISKFSTGGLHHSKMMINFYDKGEKGLFCEVIVLTCNLTAVEVAYMGACLWRSSLLPLKSARKSKVGSSKSLFESNLKYYLTQYNNDESRDLIQKISQYDFSDVKADFVGAFPKTRRDKFKNHDQNRVGFTFLRSVIGKYHEPKSKNFQDGKPLKILSQVSSFAGPCNKSPLKNIFTHILCPIFANVDFPETTQLNNKFDPMVVFPTSEDILKGTGGPEVQGQYIFLDAGPGDEQYDILMKDYFYKIDFANEMKTQKAGYQHCFVNNHSKIYCVSDNYDVISNDRIRFNSLKCVFMGSFNLSKSAWGTPTKNYEANCRNWECGILIHEAMYNENYSNKDIELVPVWNQNTAGNSLTDKVRIPIRLPFMFPVVKMKYGEPFYRRKHK